MPVNKYSLSVLAHLSFLIMLCSIHSQAQTETAAPQNHERLYQVEMIVFARNQAVPEEHWPTDIKLTYPENLLSLKSEASAYEEFSLLAANKRLLNPHAATVSKGGYSLLYHQAWRQTIYGRKTNIAISGGKTFNGHQELEGSIALSVGQYLRIQTNLWLTQFVPAGSNVTETWPKLPPRPNASNSEDEKNQDYLIKRIVKLNQERSMRSNEIHYIDHPLFGIIIKIIPVETSSTKPN
ncbi:MAG TPA: CsiV family protein [Cellvibrio sp.]|mgnify:CR=1 FL=1|nr:CsiV family protein [Cellvibrio sp.]